MYCDKRDHIVGKTILDNYLITKKIYENWLIKVCICFNLSEIKEYIIKLVRIFLIYLQKQERRFINNSILAKETELLLNKKLYILPELIKFGFESEYNYLIISSPKLTLEQLILSHKKTFPIKRACELTLNIIESIEILHNHNIIHRDIKPQILAIELKGKKTEIFKFLDFGFWKYYKNKNGHIPCKQYKNIIGKNIIFGSINALNKMELSRRDDLESIGYILVYLIKGCLPWEYPNINNKEEKIKKIKEMKTKINDKILCECLPEEIKLFVSYIKNLKFDEDPDYNYLKNLLKVIINTKNSDKDFYFDLKQKNI